jgi:hypothetical protein
VDAGSREESASKEESRASVLIQSEPMLQADISQILDVADDSSQESWLSLEPGSGKPGAGCLDNAVGYI